MNKMLWICAKLTPSVCKNICSKQISCSKSTVKRMRETLLLLGKCLDLLNAQRLFIRKKIKSRYEIFDPV